MAELISEYCHVATDRIEQFRNGNLKVRPIGKPVHVPTGKEKVSQIPKEWLEIQT